MNKKITLLLLLIAFSFQSMPAQNAIKSVIEPLKNERWWGGLVALGNQMPFTNLGMQDMSRNNLNNQVVPFMLSSEGRYIWSENPFRFEVKDGQLIIYSDTE